ncbi:MAG: hypothetical protein ACRD2H_13090 [Terriglobales bacterium]
MNIQGTVGQVLVQAVAHVLCGHKSVQQFEGALAAPMPAGTHGMPK